MTNNEVALKLAQFCLEVSDACALAGEIAEAHDAADAARTYCRQVMRAECGEFDEYAIHTAFTLERFAYNADWFATQCLLG